jgi:hypothetical protein
MRQRRPQQRSGSSNPDQPLLFDLVTFTGGRRVLHQKGHGRMIAAMYGGKSIDQNVRDEGIR